MKNKIKKALIIVLHLLIIIVSLPYVFIRLYIFIAHYFVWHDIETGILKAINGDNKEEV